ncbi:3-deoxy-D-manno-octulosonate 8-phosphate phosphatase [Anaerosporomusa subterranea]|uniref:3-deoxy-D-manno-octulosonate 8-phosphate phosphatase n=1 Tax=Anaerosporomusa subterranea TaxID=1794912 RepID=A0A154BRA0_ANASB|nr:HAD-IIIA family hydrolase [Anaerosporomusa subterranea]KYZ76385.1 3-deoxy-D-manno-octulosonate 8-phosphate phosphatase [Anaerosporomusa subterranea]
MDRVDRARQIRLLVLDVDGVLTNNQLIFGNDGEILKVFHSQDGLGIAAAHKAGLKTAIITGRNSEMVRRRGEELKIGDLYQGSMDKVSALNELLSKHRLTLDNIAYVGDDLNDLPVLSRAGLACAVANAVPEVKAAAHYIASHEGGRGAVREIIEYILKAQDKWDWVVEQYMAVGPIETQQ